MNILSESQLEAVHSSEKSIVVIASAGSGKTRVIVERIARILNDNAHPSGIVAITFTNAAANELRKRLDDKFEEHPNWTGIGYVGTLHGFCIRLLSHYHFIVGLPKRFGVANDKVASRMLDESISRMKYKGSKTDVRVEMKRGPFGLPKRLSKPQLVAVDYYDRIKRDAMLDYDMILQYTVQLLALQLADHKPVAIRSGFPPVEFLFADENQDSGELDERIYRILPCENKFFVGDPDQAIYGFRGGKVDNILNNDGHRILLQENYRCDLRICEAAQSVILHNEKRIPKSVVSATGGIGEVTVSEHPNVGSEVLTIADEIRRSGSYDCAVLLRYNSHVAEYARMLKDNGIPVCEKRIIELPEDWELAMIAVNHLSNPDNDALTLALLKAKDGDYATKVSAHAASEFETINNVSFHTPPDVEPHFVPDYLVKFGISKASVNRVIDTIATLTPDAGMEDLVIALGVDLQESKESGQGVTVTTMHSAKGREWSTVYLPAFEDHIMPGTDEIESERRLAYVAMTRAKHALFISHVASRKAQYGSGSVESKPSRFIKEMN